LPTLSGGATLLTAYVPYLDIATPIRGHHSLFDVSRKKIAWPVGKRDREKERAAFDLCPTISRHGATVT
jgi:hypothetical protein